MFTGIIEDIGTIVDIRSLRKEKEFTIQSKIAPSLQNGQSVAVNGVCLSVVTNTTDQFKVLAVYETLQRTNLSELKKGNKVHLERALSLFQRFDGHIVQGHIDGIGKIKKIERFGDSKKMILQLPDQLMKYIVPKGSIALSGVSLTIVEKFTNSFSVVAIPLTLSNTLMDHWKVHDKVNVEIDIIAKYVESLARHIK
ncbi:MAG: riboflavin synthase [bacterium]|nr:riboflavin synthase [bacterium]